MALQLERLQATSFFFYFCIPIGAFVREQVLQDWLILTSLPRLGRTMISKLVEEFGSPAHVLAASPEKLKKINGIGQQAVRLLSDRVHIEQVREKVRHELALLDQHNISTVPLDDARYPSLLANIPDSPLLLYLKGRVECLQRQAVAIIGSRSATSYGRRVAFQLAKELAGRGVCIVSGLAMGIDGEAHTGALAAGGETVGVLGCGIDVVYPRQHQELFNAIEEKGLIVSEYPTGTRPDGFRFPERNRIISGLAQGVIVVEATRKSGSLITAKLALDQGREVFAVPGRIDSIKSQGTHMLIQEGAKLVQNVDDVLVELDLLTEAKFESGQKVTDFDSASMSEEEMLLMNCLDVYPVNIDELVHNSGYDSADVSDMLLRMELKGLVRQLPGQQYERIQ